MILWVIAAPRSQPAAQPAGTVTGPVFLPTSRQWVRLTYTPNPKQRP